MASLNPVADTFDPFNPKLNNEDQLAALERSLRLSESYALLIAVTNRPELRKQLIQDLRERLPEMKIDDFAVEKPITNLYRELQGRHLDSEQLPDALFAWGFEFWMASDGSGEVGEFVSNLNVTRDHFTRFMRCPLVLWLPQHGLDFLVTRAPDFFSGRSGVFFFAADSDERKAMENSMQLMGLEGVAGLTFSEKRARLADVEHLLEQIASLPEKERDPAQEKRLLQAAAETYFVLGEFLKAEPLLRRALAIDEITFGRDDPRLAVSLSNLSSVLQSTGRILEAEPLMYRALLIDQKNLGPDHPYISIRLNNLAQLYKLNHRIADAEALLRRALAIHESHSNSNHFSLSAILSNLALLLQESNRSAEAEPLVRRALALDEKSYGPTHPNVAIRLGNLAAILQSKNILSEAESLFRRALNIDEASFGSVHPNVATDLNNLGRLLQESKRLSEAEISIRRALEISMEYERRTGVKHPKIKTFVDNYARLLREVGRTPTQIEMIVDGVLDLHNNEKQFDIKSTDVQGFSPR